MPTSSRGPLLTVAALCFALLGVLDIMKPLRSPTRGWDYAFFPELMEFQRVQTREQPALVFFGKRLSGTPNMILAPLFGFYLLVYAAGIWRMRRWALPMGVAYAIYVVLNLTLFVLRDPAPMRHGVLFDVAYVVVAVGVSSGAALMLARTATASAPRRS